MKKMKYELYDRIIKDSTLSRLELSFLLWLAAHQDTRGNVTGIYYHDVAAELHCSVSGFYLVRDNLVQKGYIQYEKNDMADMDVRLYDNCFEIDDEIIYENYIDLDVSIFADRKFYDCKAGAIRLAMYYIKRVEAAGAVTGTNSPSIPSREAENRRKLWYKPLKLYKVLESLIGVDARSLKEYMKSLKDWFSEGIIRKDGMTYRVITVLSGSVKKNSDRKSYPEREAYRQKVKMFCRRNKIEHTDKMLTDTADLIRQYRPTVSRANRVSDRQMDIVTLICMAISSACDGVLNSYNVHKALRNLIEYNAPGIFAG